MYLAESHSDSIVTARGVPQEKVTFWIQFKLIDIRHCSGSLEPRPLPFPQRWMYWWCNTSSTAEKGGVWVQDYCSGCMYQVHEIYIVLTGGAWVCPQTPIHDPLRLCTARLCNCRFIIFLCFWAYKRKDKWHANEADVRQILFLHQQRCRYHTETPRLECLPNQRLKWFHPYRGKCLPQILVQSLRWL